MNKMFKNLYNIFFKESVNADSMKKHSNDPIWVDNNWDKLVDIDDFDFIIKTYFLQMPNIEMLNILLKHNYNFNDFCKRILLRRYGGGYGGGLSYEIFKWLINNNLVKSDNREYFDMCNNLLYNMDLIAFEKFIYAFEAGFPCSNNCIVKVSNVEVAEKFWQYMNNSRNINFRYTIGNITDLKFLKDYIDWIKLHGINDNFGLETSLMAVARFIGIPGLEILLSNGYLKSRLFTSKDINFDIKNWLIEHGFTEMSSTMSIDNLIYNTTPIVNNVSDNISVATEKII